MRILHVTDTHLGIDRWFRGAPRGWRRSDDHLAAFRLAVTPALHGEVDLVVHTGDLFDRSHPPAKAVAAAAALLAEVARIVPVVLLPGNHDRQGLRAHLTTPIPGLHVLDTAAAISHAGLRLAIVPYLASAAAWAAAAREVCSDGVDLLLAHQAFDGVRVPGFVFREGASPDTVGPRHMPPHVSHVLNGHIHPRQAVRVGDTLVVHPGSAERTAFSEHTDTKGTAIWELGAAQPWRFVDLPTRPMVVVRTPDDLALVSPEALVLVTGAAPDLAADLDAAALARGAWVASVARPAPTPQISLFAPRRP
jgi:DNA repair exonuclease SbcCD nuclease subunit